MHGSARSDGSASRDLSGADIGVKSIFLPVITVHVLVLVRKIVAVGLPIAHIVAVSCIIGVVKTRHCAKLVVSVRTICLVHLISQLHKSNVVTVKPFHRSVIRLSCRRSSRGTSVPTSRRLHSTHRIPHPSGRLILVLLCVLVIKCLIICISIYVERFLWFVKDAVQNILNGSFISTLECLRLCRFRITHLLEIFLCQL